MRVLRWVPAISFALFLVSCDRPPTALDEAPQLMKAANDNMLVPWFLYEGLQPTPCADGGAGADFLWSGEIAGFGKEHVTPSGNYHRVLTVEFRNVEMRSPTGELYPFRKVEQTEVTNVQEGGQTNYHFSDNEFYKSPDGRNLKVRFNYHLVVGVNGPPKVERLMISCSPAKW
jgi:hypothetical protein